MATREVEQAVLIVRAEPEDFNANLSSEFAPPSTDLERTIAGIWQEVLGLSRVGVNDNFFELGGHSLMVVAIHSRMKKVLDVGFPMAQMFQFPTVSSLARHLSQDQEAPVGKADDLKSRAQRQRESMARSRRVAS